MKTKFNFKLLIALGIMLLAVVFNISTVNATLDLTDINSQIAKEEAKAFNSRFESYAGEILSGSDTKALLNQVKSNNASSEYKVKANKEISEIIITEKYGVILKYDNEGKVNEVIIGQNIKYGEITIISSGGTLKTTFEPGSGGGPGVINANADYSNCLYAIAVKSNYGQSIETELGTFTYNTKYQDLGKMLLEQDNVYVYTCPVKMSDIASQKYKLNLVFSATNIDTNKDELVNANIDVFRTGYKENANLKVGDTNFIVNGKIIQSYISEENTFVGYNEITNTLEINNYTGKVVYSNMGGTFKIRKNENSNVEEVCEDKNININTIIITSTDNKTKIEFVAPIGTVTEDTIMEVTLIDEGRTYNNIKDILSDIERFVAFDITLTSNGIVIQPSGKVKISIPIPSDYDKTKLAVYRVAEDGTKTEYNTKVEGEFAVIETDHFSTYVLAEKNVTDTEAPKTEETPKVEDTPIEEIPPKGEKDNTPKTGTIETIYYILPVMLLAIVGIVALTKKENK